MGTVRGDHPLSLILLLVLSVSCAAAAAAGETKLYDQPVLTLNPGMHTAPIRHTDVSTRGMATIHRKPGHFSNGLA